MKAAYVITGFDTTLERLASIWSNDGKVYETETDDAHLTAAARDGSDFLKVEQETREGLMQEWTDGDKMCKLLFEHPRFAGRSTAFYVTYSHSGPQSNLLLSLIATIVAAQDCLLYECSTNSLSEGAGFVASGGNKGISSIE